MVAVETMQNARARRFSTAVESEPVSHTMCIFLAGPLASLGGWAAFRVAAIVLPRPCPSRAYNSKAFAKHLRRLSIHRAAFKRKPTSSVVGKCACVCVCVHNYILQAGAKTWEVTLIFA